MRDVLVNGVFVIEDGELDIKVFPGKLDTPDCFTPLMRRSNKHGLTTPV
jgi:hypothetical protein